MTRKLLLKGSVLIAVALGLSGCEGDLLVFGNMATMGITCAMLWSTVHLKKDA
jgi:hypothetical protein